MTTRGHFIDMITYWTICAAKKSGNLVGRERDIIREEFDEMRNGVWVKYEGEKGRFQRF